MKKIPHSFLTFVFLVTLLDAAKSIAKAQEYFTFSEKAVPDVLQYSGLSLSGTLDRHRRAAVHSEETRNASDVSETATSSEESTTDVTTLPMDSASDSSTSESAFNKTVSESTPIPPASGMTTTPLMSATTSFGTETIRDFHRYYVSHIYNEATMTQPYLETFRKKFIGVPPSHDFLKNGLGRVKLFKSSFDFLFYGHSMNTIALTTGGFVYMSDFLHPYLTHSQYIAPLMTQFHTINNKSDVYHVDDGSTFWVLWKDMYLKDKESAGPFTFYMAIHKNGTIIFVYDQLSILPKDITGSRKIGLSDAFYQDVMFALSIRLRRIYRYHLLEIRPDKIRNGTVVVLEALPTCHEMPTCNSCLSNRTDFTCRWCPTLNRCSSGIDRKRQEWVEQSCHILTSGSTDCNARLSVAAAVGIVMLVLTALAVSVGVGIWCRYAYTNPSSPSGIWLMEHRPSVIKQKMTSFFRDSNSPGERYHVSFNTHESVA